MRGQKGKVRRYNIGANEPNPEGDFAEDVFWKVIEHWHEEFETSLLLSQLFFCISFSFLPGIISTDNSVSKTRQSWKYGCQLKPKKYLEI